MPSHENETDFCLAHSSRDPTLRPAAVAKSARMGGRADAAPDLDVVEDLLLVVLPAEPELEPYVEAEDGVEALLVPLEPDDPAPPV